MIHDWVDLNIRKDRDPAEKHLYIYGETQLGKTTFVSNLRKALKVYEVPYDEDFYDYYEDGLYDLAVLDEFKGNKKIGWLNQFLQGHPFSLRRKGLPAYIKRQNLPVIILSNFDLHFNYKKTLIDKLKPLLRRLTCVHVYTPINLSLTL